MIVAPLQTAPAYLPEASICLLCTISLLGRTLVMMMESGHMLVFFVIKIFGIFTHFSLVS